MSAGVVIHRRSQTAATAGVQKHSAFGIRPSRSHAADDAAWVDGIHEKQGRLFCCLFSLVGGSQELLLGDLSVRILVFLAKSGVGLGCIFGSSSELFLGKEAVFIFIFFGEDLFGIRLLRCFFGIFGLQRHGKCKAHGDDCDIFHRVVFGGLVVGCAWLRMSKGYDEENAVAAQIFCDPHFIGCSTELIACPIALSFWSELLVGDYFPFFKTDMAF